MSGWHFVRLAFCPHTLSSSICSSSVSSSSTFFAALSCMSVVAETTRVGSEGAEGDIWRGQELMATVVHEDSEDISGLVLMTKVLTFEKHIKTKSRSCLRSCWKSILWQHMERENLCNKGLKGSKSNCFAFQLVDRIGQTGPEWKTVESKPLQIGWLEESAKISFDNILPAVMETE